MLRPPPRSSGPEERLESSAEGVGPGPAEEGGRTGIRWGGEGEGVKKAKRKKYEHL